MTVNIENGDYMESLKEFKKSMLGGSEKEQVARVIAENTPSNRIRWLDVGIGDGKFASKVKSLLEEQGFMIELTGMDPCKNSVEKARQRMPDSKIVVEDFNDKEIEGKYDLITFNQSIYYFHNKNRVIEKSVEKLSEGGILLGVVWSSKDAIYQLHKRVFGEWTIGAFTAEDFKKLLGCYDDFEKLYTEEFVGVVDFKRWKEPENLKRNLNVISRIPLSKNAGERDFKIAEKEIAEREDREERVNGIVIGKKSYEIVEFDRERVVEKVKKRFPEYHDEISKVQGDDEALFMCSWQRETESLADYIPKGKVLEICCAAGLKSVILAKKHEVTAVDINDERLEAARENARTFGVSDNTTFKNVDVEDDEKLQKLLSEADYDAIYIDVDWREDLKDPIKKQNLNPFKTAPDTKRLYQRIRSLMPEVPVIFKVSPFVRVKKLRELDPCVIEELFIDGKFLSYNVYFDPSRISRNRWQQLRIFNKDE